MLCARSPLRIDFVGMTDYHVACDQFGGRILNATINKYIYATLRPRQDGDVPGHVRPTLDTLGSGPGRQ